MRLDLELVARGLASSRTKAQALIDEGLVKVNGVLAKKVSQSVEENDQIEVIGSQYVSRGALKLLGAFEAFEPLGLSAVWTDGPHKGEGKYCLDVGASTGGFTQVLLEKGAEKVVALDVGHDQLDPKIAEDPRVVNLEGCNFRFWGNDELFDLIVSDVSFISLTYCVQKVRELLALGGEAVLLVKPQFELGREIIRKQRGGVVKDPELQKQAVDIVVDAAKAAGLKLKAQPAKSQIQGKDGNQEWLVWLEPIKLH